MIQSDFEPIFSSQLALITGASGAIGRAIAIKLAQHGASLALCGRNTEILQDLACTLGASAHPFTFDLSQESCPQHLLKDIIHHFGRAPSILIHAAGITRDNLMMRMSEEAWDEVLNVNLKSGFLLSKACLMPMIKQKYGRIILVSSVVGISGNPGQTNYAASKGGLIAMGKSLALEVASRGITVNMIAPGFITSPMTDKLSEDVKTALLQRIPIGRFGCPDDVAHAALFLASAAAGYVTGHTLNVSGGLLTL